MWLPPQPNTRNIVNLLKLFVTRVTKVRKPSRSQVCEAFGQVTYWAVFYSDHLTAFWSHVIVQVSGNFFFTVWKQNCPCPASTCRLLVTTDTNRAVIGQSEILTVSVRIKQHPQTLNSFMCNWYRPSQKKNGPTDFSGVWGRELQVTVGSAAKVSLSSSRRTARRLGVVFGAQTQLCELTTVSQGVHCQSCYLFIHYVYSRES